MGTRRYWLEFDTPSHDVHSKFGVTARDEQEAVRLVETLAFRGFVRLPPPTVSIADVCMAKLEQNHIVANSSNPNAYGIWYPVDRFKRTAFCLPREADRIRLPVWVVAPKKTWIVTTLQGLSTMARSDFMKQRHYDWVLFDAAGMKARIAAACPAVSPLPMYPLRIPVELWVTPEPSWDVSELKDLALERIPLEAAVSHKIRESAAAPAIIEILRGALRPGG